MEIRNLRTLTLKASILVPYIIGLLALAHPWLALGQGQPDRTQGQSDRTQGQPDRTQGHPDRKQSCGDLIDSFLSHTYPGQLNGGILVAEKGKIIYQKSFGMADFNAGKPNTNETRFNLASISKVITSTAILQLMERGKLKLSDPVQVYLPDFPYPNITIRHLLTHTSGLPDLELYGNLVHQYPDTIVSNKDIIPALKIGLRKLPFAPGEKWRYCNTNFDLLAVLIEKVSGMSYPQYCRKYIFNPAGMKATSVFADQAVRMAGVAASEPSGMKAGSITTGPADDKGVTAYVLANWYTQNYVAADSVRRNRYINFNLSGLYGSNNVITTTRDMLAFDEAFFGGKLLSRPSMELAFTPVRLNDGSSFLDDGMDTMLGEGTGSYGMGWDIFEQPGWGKSVGHGGYDYGLLTFYFHNLATDQTLVAFDNTAGRAFGKIVTSAFYLLNGRQGFGRTPRTSLARIYGVAMKEKGVEAAAVTFINLKADTAHYYIDEKEFNWLGYDFLRAEFDGHLQLALEVFKVNTLLFPNNFNVYDSFGEALFKSGKKEEAILMYQKSILLNPGNKEGIEALQKIIQQAFSAP